MMVRTPERGRASVFCGTNKATQSDSDLSQEGEEEELPPSQPYWPSVLPAGCFFPLACFLVPHSPFGQPLCPQEGSHLRKSAVPRQSEKFNFRITCALFIGSVHLKDRSIPNRSNAKVSYPSVRPKQPEHSE